MEMTKLEPTERNVCCCMGRAERGLLLMDDRFRNITAKVSADSINGYSARSHFLCHTLLCHTPRFSMKLMK